MGVVHSTGSKLCSLLQVLALILSEWSKRDICERFQCDPGKVHLSLNGLHPEVLKGAPAGAGDRARQDYAEGRQYMFAIGAGLERKNTGRMIEAFALARERRPDLPHLLLISGLGGHIDRFKERAQKAGVLEHVRFLPYLSQADVIALYAGADLCIVGSGRGAASAEARSRWWELQLRHGDGAEAAALAGGEARGGGSRTECDGPGAAGRPGRAA